MKNQLKKILCIGFIINFLLCGCNDNSESGQLQTSISNNKETQSEIHANTDNIDSDVVEESKKGLTITTKEKPDWNSCSYFSEGLCAVQDKSSGLWGYVDTTGEFVIPPEFYEANVFNDGLAAVMSNTGLYDFIDKSGNVTIGGYESVEERFNIKGFNMGYALVKLPDEIMKVTAIGWDWSVGEYEEEIDETAAVYGLIDNEGNIVCKLKKPGSENFMLFDINDEFVCEFPFDNLNLFESIKGILYSYDRNNVNIYDEKYNLLASYYSEIPPDDFRYPTEEYALNRGSIYGISKNNSQGFFFLCDYVDDKKRYYVVDKNGDIVFNQLDIDADLKLTATNITDNYVVMQRDVNGIVTSAVYDFNGNLILDYKYKDIVPYSKDIFLAKNNAGYFGIVDSNYEELMPFDIFHVDSLLELYNVRIGYKKNALLKFESNGVYHYFDFEDCTIKEYFIQGENAKNTCYIAKILGEKYYIYKVDNNRTEIYDNAGMIVGSFDLGFINTYQYYDALNDGVVLAYIQRSYNFCTIKHE